MAAGFTEKWFKFCTFLLLQGGRGVQNLNHISVKPQSEVASPSCCSLCAFAPLHLCVESGWHYTLAPFFRGGVCFDFLWQGRWLHMRNSIPKHEEYEHEHSRNQHDADPLAIGNF